MSGPPGPIALPADLRLTPVVEILYDVTNLNNEISSLSSYVQSLGPTTGPTAAQFQALSNEFNAESTNISSLSVAYSTNRINFINLSTYFQTISSGLSLVKKVGYLSSQTTLYFGGSTFASSFTINKSLNVGSNTIGSATIFNAAIGSNNTMNSNFGLLVGQLNTGRLGSVGQGYGNNFAGGLYSHAEGSSSEISGSYSHTEGGQNSNFGQRAHTEGYRNYIGTLGSFSHAEGYGQFIEESVDSVHAEGYFTNIYGAYSHTEGTFTSSIGSVSHAEGFGSVASNAHAEGWLTTSLGIAGHTEGYSTIVSGAGNYAHAEGSFTRVTGLSGHAEGFRTLVTSSYGHAEGWNTTVSSVASHSEGRDTEADGDYSHAEGISTIATDELSHVEGSNNRAVLSSSHVEGLLNSSVGVYCHTHGTVNLVSSTAAHAHGYDVDSLNTAAHAHNSNVNALGIASHAHGYRLTGASTINALGNYSHTHGCNAVASGIAATCIGAGTPNVVNGNYSFGCGQFNRVVGSNVFASGSYITNLNSEYSYLSYLGGSCNVQPTSGSIGVSSGVQTAVFPGLGCTVLGGFGAFPRNNWSLVNNALVLPTIVHYGTNQTEWFHSYCTTSTSNTYSNLIYLSNKADQVNPTTSNMNQFTENNRNYTNTFEVQLMGYEKENISTTIGAGIYSANYRFMCYGDNISTVAVGTQFRSWTICDSDGNTSGINTFKELCTINTLNKLSGTPAVSLRAYISTLNFSNFVNNQSITSLSVKADTGIPINWYAQIKQGITYWTGTNGFR